MAHTFIIFLLGVSSLFLPEYLAWKDGARTDEEMMRWSMSQPVERLYALRAFSCCGPFLMVAAFFLPGR